MCFMFNRVWKSRTYNFLMKLHHSGVPLVDSEALHSPPGTEQA